MEAGDLGIGIYAGRDKVVCNQQNKNISTRTNPELLPFSPGSLIDVRNSVVLVTRMKQLGQQKDRPSALFKF